MRECKERLLTKFRMECQMFYFVPDLLWYGRVGAYKNRPSRSCGEKRHAFGRAYCQRFDLKYQQFDLQHQALPDVPLRAFIQSIVFQLAISAWLESAPNTAQPQLHFPSDGRRRRLFLRSTCKELVSTQVDLKNILKTRLEI